MLTRAAFIIALLLLGSCAPSPDAANDATHATLSIATDATFPPFHFIDENGNATGYDVELARHIALRAGYEPEIVVLPYDRLFNDLLSIEHHVVAATTGITPEREQMFLFSAPYFDTCQAALVRVGQAEPESLAELAGRKVGAAGAGTSVNALKSLADVVPVLLSEREATEDTIQADGSVPVLEDGDIDALIVDEFDAVSAARVSNGRLRVLPEPVASEQYGFVFAPGNVEVKQAFDSTLAAMQEDGSLDNLKRRFGLHRDTDWPVSDLR